MQDEITPKGLIVPSIHVDKGYRFFLFTNEAKGEPRIHIDQQNCYAVFSLHPVTLERVLGFSEKQLDEIRSVVEEFRGIFLMKWDEYVGR